jgi:hypothetical protein
VLFVVLVFVGSAVVSLPESDDPAEAISSFYQVHRSAVVITQAVGLAAVVVLLLVLAVLLRWVGGGWPLLISGGLVALASLATAVPVLVLALDDRLGASGTRSAARWADWTDDALFVTIALFVGVVATRMQTSALRVSCAVVAVACALRGVGAALGFHALDVVAPLMFLILMIWLGIARLRTTSAIRSE